MKDGYEMTQSLEDEMKKFFAVSTMIGTSYSLSKYEENIIDIEATLIVSKDYSVEEVKEEVTEYIQSYFSYGNFTFEDEIIKSELEEEVKQSIEGVKSFRINTPSTDIIQSDETYMIFSLGSLNISASGGGV